MASTVESRVEPDEPVVAIETLPTFAKMVMDPGSCLDRQLHGCMGLRKLLDVDDPSIDEIVAITGLTERLIHFMHLDSHPQLQLEAVRVFTNIATRCPARTQHVLSKECVAGFIHLLASSPQDEIQEQAAWALGGFLCANITCRDFVVACGALQTLREFITENVTAADGKKLAVLRKAVWALSCVGRVTPLPDLAVLQPTLPLLASLLTHHDDGVVASALWMLALSSDGSIDGVQAVLNAGVVPRVVQLLGAPSDAVVAAAIRIMGNLAAGNELQTQVVVDLGTLVYLPRLLTHAKRSIRRDAHWTCSNIGAGISEQIGALIQAGLVPLIIRGMKDNERKVKKDAVWTIANVTSYGTREHIKYLVELNVLEALCDVLADARVSVIALEALNNILAAGERDGTRGT